MRDCRLIFLSVVFLVAVASLPATGRKKTNFKFVEGENYTSLEIDSSSINSFEILDGSLRREDQVEVLWFFWYGCGACVQALPALEEVSNKLGKKIILRKIPLGFGSWRPEAIDHFVFKQLGVLDTVSKAFYFAVQGKLGGGAEPDQVANWLQKNFSIDIRKSLPLFESAKTLAYLEEADAVVDTFEISSVPSFVVGRRYYSNTRMIDLSNIPNLIAELVSREQQ